MRHTQVLRLDDYRERRDARLRLGASLHRADPSRAEVYRHLAYVTALLSTDRAAVVWVDEYGPGMAHPFVVLDLLSDRPRRAFGLDLLRRAWENGVPGLAESLNGSPLRHEGQAWGVAVALGSDGTRSWFLVSDTVSSPPSMDARRRERVLFLAGECSAVVLHRDLDPSGAETDDEARRPPRFAGWPILRDMEGREEDEAETRRIGLRFMVARLPRLLVDDDLALPRERFREQAEHARSEVTKDAGHVEAGPEGHLWHRVLDAYQEADLEALGRALVDLGSSVEARGHLHGALEIYRTAYEIFAATAAVEAAVDAARFSGRVSRRMALWEEAVRWYGVARDVAEAGGLEGRVALVLGGVASMHRDRGNLPAARAVLSEALPVARSSGETRALGDVYLGLAAVDHLSGRLADAMAWGWQAVETYQTVDERVIALAALGGILLDLGDVDAATDAWSCVRDMSRHDFYRLYAVDALGHLAALRGDAASFAALSAEADALDWAGGAPSARAEILLYRGLSHRALRDPARARRWLREAVSFAEEHGFSRTLFRAEAALDALEAEAADTTAPAPEPPRAAPDPLRAGLRELRSGVPSGAGA